jgi:hypothetical protein
MKILELKPQHLLLAIVIGLCIAGCITFITAPRPVVVPVQVITPVPTPPPVVITSVPAPAPAPINMNYGSNGVPIDQMQLQMLDLVYSMIPLVIALTAISMILALVTGLIRS